VTETWTKRLLLGSAVWNIGGALVSLADPAQHLAQMFSAPAPAGLDAVALFFYRCTWINVLAWGLAYGLAACWPHSRAAVLAAGGAGKALYCAASVGLVLSGVGRPLVLVFGLADLAMALLFFWALWALWAQEAPLRAGAQTRPGPAGALRP